MGLIYITVLCVISMLVTNHTAWCAFGRNPYPARPSQNVGCWTQPQQNKLVFYPPQKSQQVWVPITPQRQWQGRPGKTQNRIGSCQVRCPCPFNLDPQCGSNGITYGNKCELDCARNNCFPYLRSYRVGECSTKYNEGK